MQKTIEFLEGLVECNTDDGCGRCNELRKHIELLKKLEQQLQQAPVMPALPDAHTVIERWDKWWRSDKCWIEDGNGNKLSDAVICGKGLYDAIMNGDDA